MCHPCTALLHLQPTLARASCAPHQLILHCALSCGRCRVNGSCVHMSSCLYCAHCPSIHAHGRGMNTSVTCPIDAYSPPASARLLSVQETRISGYFPDSGRSFPDICPGISVPAAYELPRRRLPRKRSTVHGTVHGIFLVLTQVCLHTLWPRAHLAAPRWLHDSEPRETAQ